MKTKVITYVFFVLVLILGIGTSCEETSFNKNINSSNGKPGVVSVQKIENQAGAATIYYSLPAGSDVAYVEANYITKPTGKEYSIKSSGYENNITLVGFSQTEEHLVELTVVNRGGERGETLPITVTPLENPIWKIYETVEFVNDFGGFNITAENESQANIAIEIMTRDELGAWTTDIDLSVYTSQKNIYKGIRGLDTLSYDYALIIRDNYQNQTDTIFQTVNPFYEILIPKAKYQGIEIFNDAVAPYPRTNLWDNNYWDWGGSYCTSATDPTSHEYHSVTIDLGEEVLLSRFKEWEYPEWGGAFGRIFYTAGGMKHFQLWGRLDAPNPLNIHTSEADGWYLLADCNVVKSSGLPINQMNDEDYNTAVAGFEFKVSQDYGKVRYVRVMCLENWSGSRGMSIQELEFFGDPR